MDKQKFFSIVVRIHNELSPVVNFDDGEDYLANQAYNKVVVNGEHKPETMGEKVNGILARYGAIGKLYQDNCWWPDERRGDIFQFPQAAELWAAYQAAQ